MIVLWWTGALALLDPDQGVRVLPLAMFPSAGPELILGLLATGALALRQGLWRAMGLAALLSLGLSLGPRIFDLTPNPVHGLWMTLGPLARRLWFPCRALVIPALVGALALSVLLDRALDGAWRRPAAALAALALPAWLLSLVSLGVLPVLTWNPPSPAPVKWLAKQPEGSVLVLPSTKESTWLVHQIQHGKPVQLQLGGQNPLLAVPEASAWLEQHPVVDLLELTVKGHVPPRPVSDAERESLLADGFRWLLVDFGAIDSTRSPKAIQTSRRRLTRLLGEPVSSGENMFIWALDPEEAASAPRIDPEPGSSAPPAGP
ncbi:MAG: hypothetical protein H6741_19970 [Alphaproteobacteria bacterium]|nr:hypothetical protein [Alphaproteobacteria bacterium]